MSLRKIRERLPAKGGDLGENAHGGLGIASCAPVLSRSILLAVVLAAAFAGCENPRNGS